MMTDLIFKNIDNELEQIINDCLEGKEVLYNSRVCSICDSTDFKIMDGNIVCQKCGLCQEIFCNTIYGFEEFTPDMFENSFVQALQELNNDGDNSE